MWNSEPMSNSHNNCSIVRNEDIFAKLMNNFNIYEVLEPQKNDSTSKTNVQSKEKNLIDIESNLLIDISSDGYSRKDNNTMDANLNGLLCDEGKTFDCIDLYQNIFVTPQHLMKETKKEKMDTSQTNAISSIDCEEFFRKLELGHKFYENNNSPENSNYSLPSHQYKAFYERQMESPANFESKGAIAPEQVTADPEDLFQEILLEKNFNKHLRTTAQTNDKDKLPIDKPEIHQKIYNFENLATSKIATNETLSKHFVDKVMPNTAIRCNIANKINHASGSKVNSSLFDCTSGNSADSIRNSADLPDCVSNIKKSVEFLNHFHRFHFPSTCVSNYYSPIIDNKKMTSTVNNVASNTNVQLIDAVKKDEKQYSKNRIVKSDLEKRNFTKGPSLYEKSVVLPQILERLAVKQKELDERKNVKKKLILDTATRTSNSKVVTPPVETSKNKVQLKPTILMEDCNKERLKSLKQIQMIQSFVLGNQKK